MPLTNGRAILNFKINGYLKFYFFNGCITNWLERAQPYKNFQWKFFVINLLFTMLKIIKKKTLRRSLLKLKDKYILYQRKDDLYPLLSHEA